METNKLEQLNAEDKVPAKKPVEEMSEREMLVELLTEKRRQDKARVVRYAVLAAVIIAIAVLAIIYVPKIVNAYKALMETYSQVQELSLEAEEALGQVEGAVEKAHETMDNINDTLNNKLNPAIDSYNSLRDAAAQKLQEASETIGTITETLRNFFTFR